MPLGLPNISLPPAVNATAIAGVENALDAVSSKIAVVGKQWETLGNTFAKKINLPNLGSDLLGHLGISNVTATAEHSLQALHQKLAGAQQGAAEFVKNVAAQLNFSGVAESLTQQLSTAAGAVHSFTEPMRELKGVFEDVKGGIEPLDAVFHKVFGVGLVDSLKDVQEFSKSFGMLDTLKLSNIGQSVAAFGGIAAAAFAGWQIGSYLNELDFGGAKVKDWCVAVVAQIIAWGIEFWGNIRITFDGVTTTIAEWVVTGKQWLNEFLLWVASKFNNAIGNKLGISIDTTGLQNSIADAKAQLAQLEQEHKTKSDRIRAEATAEANTTREAGLEALNTAQSEHNKGTAPAKLHPTDSPVAGKNPDLAAHTNTEETRNLQTQVTTLQNQIVALQDELHKKNEPSGRSPVSENQPPSTPAASSPPKSFESGTAGIAASLDKQEAEIGTWSDRLNRAFTQIGQGIRNSLGTAFSDILLKGGSIVGKLRTLWNSLVANFAQAGAKMAADWLYQHVVMTAVRRLFHATDTALTGTEVVQHSTAEAAKTGATVAGSTSRSAVRLGETIWHGVQVAARAAAHIAGEIAQTAITVAQVPLRIAASIPETLAKISSAAAGAMSAMASIPYVGPFLAIGAMAAILAAGAKLVHGHSQGGYTADVAIDRPAGIVHGGEWVAPAWQVGHPLYGPMIAGLEAARQGKPGYKLGGFLGQWVNTFFPNPLHPENGLKNLWQSTIHPPGADRLWNSLLTGHAVTGDDSTSSWRWDTATQDWVRNSASVASAMTSPAQSAAASAASGGSSAGGSAAGGGTQINVALFDDRNQSAYEQFIRDPRAAQYVMSVVQANRRQLNIRV